MNRPPANPLPALGVVVLGAGASSRMGRPKLLLPWNGATVISHLISQWQTLRAAQIAIVCRSHDEALAMELDKIHFPKSDRIENPHPERGMFSSITCAANWTGWQKEICAWAIVLGDQPHLRPETLRRLLEFHAAHQDAVCQPEFHGKAKHPVILPRTAFFELKNSPSASLKDFLKQISRRSVQCPMNDAGLALDMDTPEDYKRMLP
ncbi:MAG: NTP transferase domain-containing protein [Limisphaerales bacterium]